MESMGLLDRLPAELRNHVYLHALVKDNPTYLVRSKQNRMTQMSDPPLTRASRALREETLPIFGSNTFILPNWHPEDRERAFLDFLRARGYLLLHLHARYTPNYACYSTEATKWKTVLGSEGSGDAHFKLISQSEASKLGLTGSRKYGEMFEKVTFLETQSQRS